MAAETRVSTGDAPSVRLPEIAIPSAGTRAAHHSPESSYSRRSLGLRVSGAVAPSAPAWLVLPT